MAPTTITCDKTLSAQVTAEPRKVRSAVSELRLSLLSWSDLAAKKEKRTALHLRGLPKVLAEKATFMALLEGQGLSEKVASIRFTPSTVRQTACAVLVATTPEDVSALAKFFHGSQLYGSRPIAVSFASDEDVLKSSKRSKLSAEAVKLNSMEKEALAGELSPTASTDIDADTLNLAHSSSSSSLEESSSPVMSFVRPPPGLEHLCPTEGTTEGFGYSSIQSSLEMPVITPPPGLEHLCGSALMAW